jgi:tetratricopeptide (TPR) repeat protein
MKVHLKSLLGDAYDNKGHILNYLNDYPTAIKCFDEAVAYFENAIDYIKNLKKDEHKNQHYQRDRHIINTDLADTYRDKGFALFKLEADGKNKERAEDYFIKATETDEKFPYAWNSLGYYYLYRSRDLEKAKGCFDKAIGLRPKEKKENQDSDTMYLAYSYYNKGYACYSEGMKNHNEARDDLYLKSTEALESAIECFDKAIGLRPDYQLLFYVLNTKGITLIYLKRYNEAIDCFNKTIKISKEKIEKLDSLGFKQSKTDWEKQLGDAYNHKGYVLNILGRYKEAIEYFNSAKHTSDNIKTFSNSHTSIEDVRKQNIFSLINRGIALFNLQKYNEAIECLTSISKIISPITLDVKYKDLILLYTGQSKYMLGDYLNARQDFQNLTLPESNMDKYSNIALCCEKHGGSFKEIEEAISEVIRSNPISESESAKRSRVIAYYNLGVLYNNNNKIDDAKKMFERCLLIDPDFFKATESLNTLDSKKNHSDWYNWWFKESKIPLPQVDNEWEKSKKNSGKNRLIYFWEWKLKKYIGISLLIH